MEKNKYDIGIWIQYLDSIIVNDDESYLRRFQVYEDCVAIFPRSYKIWKAYLDDKRKYMRGDAGDEKKRMEMVGLYERAMVNLPKMIRLWLDYSQYLSLIQKWMECKRVFDRSLRVLPITQHYRVWEEYLKFARMTKVKCYYTVIYSRYLMLFPNGREEYIEFLMEEMEDFGTAVSELIHILNDENFVSKKGTMHHTFWMKLCKLISHYPEDVDAGIQVENIIRSGLKLFTDQVGQLWCSLATYYIRLGEFEYARDIYEEGMKKIITVRDFSMIFDAYTKFEEEVLTAKMNLKEEEEVEIRLARLEYLMERRPMLLSSVLLRQNPHNVHEWLKRIKLMEQSEPEQVVYTYTEAVKTIDPYLAIGKLPTLWIQFAGYYEKVGQDVASARVIYQKAIQSNYKHIADLATVFVEWSEMELRAENFDQALQLLKAATEEPSYNIRDEGKKKTIQDRVHKSVKLWSAYLDLEESLGDFQSVKDAYERVMILDIATAQMVLNYASYLTENKYFEDSFRVYEKGIVMFTYPQLYDIWNAYITAFISRYQGKKLERLRDLFEQLLRDVPKKHSMEFYQKYANAEEKFGMIRKCMKIYQKAVVSVPVDQRLQVYKTYIKKTHEYFGINETRKVYQDAMDQLNDSQVPVLCLEFSSMEQKLGEVDRARAILIYASQFSDPQLTEDSFWNIWHEFEVEHGNEQTFLEMLRIKRAVVAQYSQVNYISLQQEAADAVASGLVEAEQNPMEQLEESALPTPDEQLTKEINPEEIDLDDEDDMQIEQMEVPDGVFGSSLRKK